MKLVAVFKLACLINLSAAYYTVITDSVSCCNYCRSEPKHWVSLGGSYQLHKNIEATKLDSPPAYLVDDEETIEFLNEGREYKLQYAGAPLRLKYGDLSDTDSLVNSQYLQVDMAEPKSIGGVLTQGGFYEEKLQGLFPYKESWVSEFVLSYSNQSDADFQLYRFESGSIQRFVGNQDALGVKLSSLSPPVTARYLRYHPLRAQNDAGALDTAHARVTGVTCTSDLCVTTRINCLMTDWSEWGECTCGASCTQIRTRSVRRVQACGGSRCGAVKESQVCVPPEPTWKLAVQYGGISLGGVLLIVVIAIVIYKKTHKDRVEVIVVKENDDDDEPIPAPRPAGMRDMDGRDMGFGPRGPGVPPMAGGFMPRAPHPGFGAPRPPFAQGGPGLRPRMPMMGGNSGGGGGMPTINN